MIVEDVKIDEVIYMGGHGRELQMDVNYQLARGNVLTGKGRICRLVGNICRTTRPLQEGRTAHDGSRSRGTWGRSG